MDIKVEELLHFCAYYTLTKNATEMPHTSYHPQVTKQQPKTPKVKRLKVEVIDNNKQKRQKVEHVPSKVNKQTSSVHVNQQAKRQPVQESTQNKAFDLNYFTKHLASQITQPQSWNQPSKNREAQLSHAFPRRNQSNLQNYETFGRSSGKPTEFEHFDAKMKKDNRGNLTERYQRGNYFEKPQFMVSQFSMHPEPKSTATADKNPWMSHIQKTFKSQYIDVQPKKNPTYSPHTLENYQQSETKMPSRRQFTPNGSAISARYSPDSNLSKSRTKHQRKKSDRPLYDPSKLTVKKETESAIRENSIDQSSLSQSFITVEDTTSGTYPKQISRDDGKRETSTTAPPLRSKRETKPAYRMQRNQTDLDDALGETLTELSHRKTPLTLQMKMKHEN